MSGREPGFLARPGGLELPTFWFVGGNRATRQPTATYKDQRNQRKAAKAFGWFRLVYDTVHGQFPLATAYSRSRSAALIFIPWERAVRIPAGLHVSDAAVLQFCQDGVTLVGIMKGITVKLPHTTLRQLR